MSEQAKNYTLVFEGTTPSEVDSQLEKYVSDFQEKFDLQLPNPALHFEILFHKGTKPDKSNLQVTGDNFEDAYQRGIRDFSISPDQFNMTYRLHATYELQAPQKEEVESKGGEACSSKMKGEKTLDYLL